MTNYRSRKGTVHCFGLVCTIVVFTAILLIEHATYCMEMGNGVWRAVHCVQYY